MRLGDQYLTSFLEAAASAAAAAVTEEAGRYRSLIIIIIIIIITSGLFLSFLIIHCLGSTDPEG